MPDQINSPQITIETNPVEILVDFGATVIIGGSTSLDQLTDVTKGNVQPNSSDTIRILADTNEDGNYVEIDYTPPGGGSLGDLSDVDITPLGDSTLTKVRILADVTAVDDNTTTGIFKVIDWSPPTGSGGETNSGVNVGGGIEIFKDKPAFDLRFRTFTEGNNINIVQSADTVDISTTATVNSPDATLLLRANHTGTQLASTISDFQATVSTNTDVAANTAKVSADGSVTTHSDITSAGSGEIITTAERTAIFGSVTEHSDVSSAGSGAIITVGERGEIAANTLKVSNATHTGQVTGATALTVQSTVITDQVTTTATNGDQVLIERGNSLFRATVDSFLSGGGGASELNDLSDVTISAPVSTATGTLRVLGDLDQDGTYTVFDWSPPSAGGGEINDGINLGTGAEVFAGKDGTVNLQFRTLVDTTEILITQNLNDLTFALGANAVNFDKIAQIGANQILGRISAGGGNIEQLVPADVRSIINVEDGAQVNTVEKVGTPANNQVGVWTGDGTLNGNEQLTWNGSTLTIAATTGNSRIRLGTSLVLQSTDTDVVTLAAIDALDATTEATIENAIDTLPNLTSAVQLSVTASQVSDFDTAVSANSDVTANTAKVSADGSVTTHNDITDAGSGAIITAIERSDITTNNAKVSADGSVTTHNDITDAGSGAIITATERSDITTNNAKVSADGSVTTHNDITDAGSGAIITTAERGAISDRTQHTGNSTYNDEVVFFETSSTQQGFIGAATTGGIYAVSSPGTLFDTNDGGILLKEGGTELYGGSIVLSNQKNGEFQQLLLDPNGAILGSPLPEPGWEVSNTDIGDYDLGTGSGAGTWVDITGLQVNFPQDVANGERINVFYSFYADNKTTNRNGVVEIGFTVEDPSPPTIVADSNVIPNNFTGFITGSFATTTTVATSGDLIRIWARINSGSHSSFGVDLTGSVETHELLVEKPSSGGTGATQLNELNDVNMALQGDTTLGKIRLLADITSPSDNTPTGIYQPVDLIINDSYCWFMPSVENKTYTLDQSSAYPQEVKSLTIQSVSGTCNITVTIDGANVTGLVNIPVSSVENLENATVNNLIPAGGKLAIVISGNSSIVDLSFTLATVRT